MPSEKSQSSAGFEPMRPAANDCLSEHRIERYLQGRLEVEDMEMVEAHISLCPDCLARFEEEAEFHNIMRPAARLVEDEQEGPETAARTRRFTPWWDSVCLVLRRRWNYVAAASLMTLGLLVVAPVIREPGPPQSVALQTMRGAASPAVANPERPLILRADIEGLDSSAGLLLLPVDSSGATIATETIPAGAREASWRISSGLPMGAYWVRVVPPADPGPVLREFSLEIR